MLYVDVGDVWGCMLGMYVGGCMLGMYVDVWGCCNGGSSVCVRVGGVWELYIIFSSSVLLGT